MQEYQTLAIYCNLLDSKLICNDPLVMTMHRSHKDLATDITNHSNGKQFHGNEVSNSKYIPLNIFLSIKFFNLTQIQTVTSTYGNIPTFPF